MESMLKNVLRHLAATKGSWPTVAEESGVPFRTLEKIGRGESRDPKISTLQMLFDHFNGRGRRRSNGRRREAA